MHYTLQTARNKDRTGLMRVLGILAPAVKGNPFEDAFMHGLVSYLIQVNYSDQFYLFWLWLVINTLQSNHNGLSLSDARRL